MERRFDMSDFEKSLKDHADQFKMTPSKRVWNGIYNNLHPGSKWPSITVAFVFIITLITIGTLNNSTLKPDRSIHTKSHSAASDSKPPVNATEEISGRINSRTESSFIEDEKNVNNGRQEKPEDHRNTSSEKISASSLLKVVKNLTGKGKPESKIQDILPSNTVSIKGKESKLSFIDPSAVSSVSEQKIPVSVLQESLTEKAELQPAFAQRQDITDRFLFIPVSYDILSIPSSQSLSSIMSADRIEPVPGNQIDILGGNTAGNYEFFKKKKNNKIEWTFYLNPTISTVVVNKKTIQPSDNTSPIVVLSNQPSFRIIHNPRFGVETGAEMSLRIEKKLQFITGLNLSYSGYNNVSNLVHPTFATLNLVDNNGQTYSKNYITHYGNGQSQDHINLVNYSIEASIPLGLQYNIWANQKIKIDISSLLEPSVIMRDDAYLISSDGRYYVNDPMLVRRTNLDGHFGSYITLIGKKIKWHLGPNFRYQLLSTYKNIYPTKEHLIDYGIRIGISK